MSKLDDANSHLEIKNFKYSQHNTFYFFWEFCASLSNQLNRVLKSYVEDMVLNH